MIYEVIKEIKNECANNQMRDVFFEELEIDDPEVWIRRREPKASSIEREDVPGGIRFFVDDHGMITVYSLTIAE
ncbi:MAG: hypothetical protein IKQ10_09130 [Oscillospiraceae bacterium]|nr:hypothetical protein [Oscillospiraceae bacterium]